jgi:hypothetical protein
VDPDPKHRFPDLFARWAVTFHPSLEKLSTGGGHKLLIATELIFFTIDIVVMKRFGD